MRNRIILVSLALLLLTAIGAAPRYLEELRIGGGYNDPINGGADFEADGDILTGGNVTLDGNINAGGNINASGAMAIGGTATIAGTTTLGGDLYINGSDILTTQDTLYFNPDGAGRFVVGPGIAQLENSAGRLWFVNTQGNSSHFRFFLPDSSGPSQDYGSLWCVVTDSTDGSEDATFRLALVRDGAYDYDVFSVNSMGDGRVDGSLSANGGTILAGIDSISRGVVSMARGSGGSQPGCARLQSRNGASWYLFVEDDGTLRVHDSLPASNSDGVVVGLQN